MVNLPRCPYCRSENIEPVGTKLWHCRDCKSNFPEAVVDEPQEAPKKKGGNHNGNPK